jgi:hypothetical protein
MTTVLISGACASVLVVLVLAGNQRAVEHGLEPAALASIVSTESADLLYGRVTTDNDGVYQGRLRFGADEEAFWSHFFNGVKADNPWARHTELGQNRRSIRIFGFEIPFGAQPHLTRPLMARFGDIARLEARGRDLWVTLKSGTTFHLDRFAADDFADGVRVWDGNRGVVDLDEWRIRSIEFLPAAGLTPTPERLHGTVRTVHGDFEGFIQWDRKASLGADELVGHTVDGERRLRFDSLRTISRRSRDSSLVTLLDGRELVLSGTREVGTGHRGIYVDDRRYGRVLVSWDAFQRIDFSAGGSGPAYTDFPPGGPLSGRVTTRHGRHLTGRLIYDLDESETTETLDAPSRGVDFTIPFGLIASIAPIDREHRGAVRARVTLHDGDSLLLERHGDLGEGNAGILIFIDGGQPPGYVQWSDVERIDFDRPSAMYPPLTRRGDLARVF